MAKGAEPRVYWAFWSFAECPVHSAKASKGPRIHSRQSDLPGVFRLIVVTAAQILGQSDWRLYAGVLLPPNFGAYLGLCGWNSYP